MEKIRNIQKLSEMNQKCEAAKLKDYFNYVVTNNTEGDTIIAAFIYKTEAVQYMIENNLQNYWYLICTEE